MESPDADLVAASARLVAAVEAVLPEWVERSVAGIVAAWPGPVPEETAAEARAAGRRAEEEVGAELRRLVAADVDDQRTNPMTLLRGAVRFPTEVLREAGVPPVERDAYDERHFPDDDYGLTPRAFADVDPALEEPGVAWGAAKARAHLARRRGA